MWGKSLMFQESKIIKICLNSGARSSTKNFSRTAAAFFLNRVTHFAHHLYDLILYHVLYWSRYRQFIWRKKGGCVCFGKCCVKFRIQHYNTTHIHTHTHTKKSALLPKYGKYLSAWTHSGSSYASLPLSSAMGHADLPALSGSRHFEPRAAVFPCADSTGHKKSFITENHSVSSKILSSRSCLLFRAEACSYLHILKRLAAHIPSELVKADGNLSAGRGTHMRVVYSHPDTCVQRISPAALSSGWATRLLLLLLQELDFIFIGSSCISLHFKTLRFRFSTTSKDTLHPPFMKRMGSAKSVNRDIAGAKELG